MKPTSKDMVDGRTIVGCWRSRSKKPKYLVGRVATSSSDACFEGASLALYDIKCQNVYPSTGVNQHRIIMHAYYSCMPGRRPVELRTFFRETMMFDVCDVSGLGLDE
jgi:hypothetical protein